MAGMNGLGGALARKARAGLGGAMAQMSLNDPNVEGKDLAPIAPANVIVFPEADIATIPGFKKETDPAKVKKDPAMVQLAKMEAEALAIKARHPKHTFALSDLNERDIARGSLDRLDKSEQIRHDDRVAELALRRAVLEAMQEDDDNMRRIYRYYKEAERHQAPQEVKRRNKEQTQLRKQESNALWADGCKKYDRRKAKRVRGNNADSDSDDDDAGEYNPSHQVHELQEDDQS